MVFGFRLNVLCCPQFILKGLMSSLLGVGPLLPIVELDGMECILDAVKLNEGVQALVAFVTEDFD